MLLMTIATKSFSSVPGGIVRVATAGIRLPVTLVRALIHRREVMRLAELDAKAVVTLVPGTGITGSAITLVGKVPGIDAAKFKELAEKAKAECPVSKALGAIKVSLDARLA